MKKASAFFLITVLLLFSTDYLQSAGDLQDTKLDRLLRRLEKKYDTTEAFSYDFEQIKSLRQLTEPMRFTGTMVFRKPHFLRMEMRGEENLNLFVDGKSIWLEDLDFGEVERFDFDEVSSEGRLARMLPPIFVSGMDEIRDLFHIRLDEEREQDVVEMTPKEEDLSSVRRIRFSVDSLSRIRWMRVDYVNDDWTDTRFTGWKTMPKISEHYFRYRK